MAEGVFNTTKPDTPGVLAESTQFNGVRGISFAPNHAAVAGIQENQSDQAGPGVLGTSKGTGVWGQSRTWMGVFGFSESVTGGAGVMGEATGPGVIGVSKTWHGVFGETKSITGGAGMWGEHKGEGVGVVGVSAEGVGVLGKGKRLAALFQGDVEVTGDIRLVNADGAELFDAADPDEITPGTVVVVDDSGTISPSTVGYDRTVIGIVSGAGAFRPGIVLDNREDNTSRLPVAVFGKVYVHADATTGAIAIGDLLCSSPTPGHAMKAADPGRAFGAVIGKALGALREGQGMIPVLVSLQ
ncbi:hypothetical protein ACTMTI_24475 [Nonomuraea sp. H19]|uniref:hypothetical protein n=1 Tax=Nonomuraea sp. H19 TaxID=3452206 RepID=UPI003F8A7F6F